MGLFYLFYHFSFPQWYIQRHCCVYVRVCVYCDHYHPLGAEAVGADLHYYTGKTKTKLSQMWNRKRIQVVHTTGKSEGTFVQEKGLSWLIESQQLLRCLHKLFPQNGRVAVDIRQAHKHTRTQIDKYTNIRIHNYTNTPIHNYTYFWYRQAIPAKKIHNVNSFN